LDNRTRLHHAQSLAVLNHSRALPQGDARRWPGAPLPGLEAYGFTLELLIELCIAELAIVTPQRMVIGGRTVEVVRMKITEAGRRALT